MRRWWIPLVVSLPGLVAQADAAVEARLDRDHVALGDTINLTIEAEGASGNPNLSPLRKDFDVQGVSTGSQTTIVNGSMHSSLQWSVVLVPRHGGMLDIPAIDVGSQKTSPLRVLVDASRNAGNGANPSGGMQPANPGGDAGSPVFIESSFAPERPYVGQAAIYTVRLYYAVSPFDAALDVSSTDNGDLRQVGRDQNGSAMVRGRRYDVLERHYLLLPEHSGSLHIPAPVFSGRAMPDINGVFDDSPGIRSLHVVGRPMEVQVRPRPAQANDPWLPAQSVTLTIDPPAAASLHAGEPFSLVVHEAGEGVTAAQLPEIALPAIPGAQVYPEPSSTEEHARDGTLHAERTRRFAIVADRAGSLHVPGVAVPWWDLASDRPAVARVSLPDLRVQAGVAATNAGAGGDTSGTGASATRPGAWSSSNATLRGWQIATLALSVLLVATFAWGWRRGAAADDETTSDDGSPDSLPGSEPRALSRALAAGDPATIARALCDAAPGTRPRHLRDVAQRLADPGQREAVQAFDAARWSSDGQPSAQALERLRTAFARTPRWTQPARDGRAKAGILPPLYPD